MIRYEVWDKSKYERSNAKPEDVFFVIDSAYDKAKDLSKGQTHTTKIYKYDPSLPWSSQVEDVEIPNVFVVIEKDKLVTLRGYGISGKLLFPKDCKRCYNSGVDQNHYGLPCNACSGACIMKV